MRKRAVHTNAWRPIFYIHYPLIPLLCEIQIQPDVLVGNNAKQLPLVVVVLRLEYLAAHYYRLPRDRPVEPQSVLQLLHASVSTISACGALYSRHLQYR